MRYKIQFMLLLLAVMIALLASAVGPLVVFADDGVTPEAPSGEPAGDEPLVDETVPSDEEAVPVDETVPSEEEIAPVDEPAQVAEILEQIPEGTEVIVVNEEGEVEPLATEEAAAIIVAGDPVWCPVGDTPGDPTCTTSQPDFESLLTVLTTDGGTNYSGNGIIWVEDTYNGNDDDQIEFNGSTLSWLDDLDIRGGWSGGNNTTINPGATSELDVSMIFLNWGGNITLSNLNFVAADDAGFGLSITNTGTATLENVSVNNTPENSYGAGDGAIITSTGDVDITGSEFDGNAGNGLQVTSGGTIELDTVSASNNTLTGAFLDSCVYDDVTGLCAGNGSVIVNSATGNLFNNNDYTGLQVDSGGGIYIGFTQASGNEMDGANLTSYDANGTGDVELYMGDFSGNSNGVGLEILTDGYIMMEDIVAQENGTGALLDSGTSTSIADSNFGDSALTGNYWTGLHIDSGSTVTLSNVISSFNGTNGAYIDAQSHIDINGSAFNENVQFNYPQDPGLFAKSNGGDITLVDVVADGNVFGAGAVLLTNGDGEILVDAIVPGDSHFNANGIYGVQAQTQNGDITFEGVDASNNVQKGIYAETNQGNVFVNDGVFFENGIYGIYVTAGTGDIVLDQVLVDGDDGLAPSTNLTDVGASLHTYSGNVFVTDSSFVQNTNAGLVIVANSTVDLVNVTTDDNGGNGAEVYSTYTASCLNPDSEVLSVVVNVDGGDFTNNGKYGLMVKPGPDGTLVFVTPATFGGNGLGDYLIDLSDPEACPEEQPTDPGDDTDKPNSPNIVYVPSTGGEPVQQQCDLFSSTILQLPNGNWVNVGCPFEGFSNLAELPAANLPGNLGAGTDFVSGVTVSLTDEEGNAVLNEDGTVTINFAIPENSRARSYSILFWDPTLNNGEGGWVKMPVFEFGTSFPLHPDDPEDDRVIVSGVQQVGNTLTITVNFPGVFIMVSP